MARLLDGPAADLARRHVLKMGSSGSAFVVMTALGLGSANAHGQAWGWGRGGKHGGRKGGHGGASSANCLLKGSRILTDQGEVPVEVLKIGDRVLTATKGSQPIKWIARQTFRRTPGRPWLNRVVPVRVAASAIRPGVPARDIHLSCTHGIWLEGVLVPVEFLCNGSTVDWADVEAETTLECYNIELDTHEVLFADGLPVETLYGAHEHFDNFAEFIRLYGDEAAQGPAGGRLPTYIYRGRTAAKELAALLLSPVIGTKSPAKRAYLSTAARARELALTD